MKPRHGRAVWHWFVAVSLLHGTLLSGCGSGVAERGAIGATAPTASLAAPEAPPPPAPIERPPESGPAPHVLFPRIVDDTPQNGLPLRTVERKGLPLVELNLAYSTGSRVRELARGPVPIVLSAGTRTEKAAQTLDALLDHVDRIGREPVSESELTSAATYLADGMLINTETVDALAALSASLVVLGLPAGYYNDYRAAVWQVSTESVLETTRRFFTRDKAIAVIAGSADSLAIPMSRIAPVVVLDPEDGFTVKRRLAHRPESASVPELDSPQGASN